MNYDYIHSLNPVRVAFKGLIFYFFIFLITPAHIGIPLSPIPFIYIILCYFSFILGTIPLRAINIEKKKKFSTLSQNRIFYSVLILSILGVTLRILERLVFRGVVIGGEATSRT